MLAKDVTLGTIVDMRVDRCRHNGTMPKQRLYKPEVDPLFQEHGCDRMPKNVWGNLADLCGLRVAPQRDSNGLL